MIQRILVPLAFSPHSKGILNYAVELVGAVNGELIIANIIDIRDLEAIDKITSHGYEINVEDYIETIKQERRDELKDFLRDISLPEGRVSYMFCLGDPTTELIQLILDRQVDTVVMGVKAWNIRYIFAGSVAEQMFRRCPVTIISYRGEELQERLTKRFLRHHKDNK